MRAARANVKTQIAGVTISMHHEDTEHVMIYFPGLDGSVLTAMELEGGGPTRFTIPVPVIEHNLLR